VTVLIAFPDFGDASPYSRARLLIYDFFCLRMELMSNRGFIC
jgi:hypothetical protein